MQPLEEQHMMQSLEEQHMMQPLEEQHMMQHENPGLADAQRATERIKELSRSRFWHLRTSLDPGEWTNVLLALGADEET